MLSSHRVIELSSENSAFCGQILADLGADVVAVEPRGGSAARRVGPFVRAQTTGPPAHLERSLFWRAHCRSKSSLVLDLDDYADRSHLEDLLGDASFLIDAEPAGRLAALGFAPDEIQQRHPHLVHASISPFGLEGPKAGWAATDLTVMAASGFAYLSGDADGPPLRLKIPQAHAHAGADAAVAALIAHTDRERSGLGQHIDISMQQSTTLANMFRTLDAAIEMAPAQRIANGLHAGGVFIPLRHRTADGGWVTLGPSVMPSTGHFMKRLLAWVAEEGFCDPSLAEQEWGTFGMRVGARQLPEDAYDETFQALERFFATKTKAELIHAAVERKLLLAPVLGIDEIAECEQLNQRGFMVRIPDAEERHPGAFARFGASPLRVPRRAPHLDEHRHTLLAQRHRPRPSRPAPARPPDENEAPLAGLKVLDLSWVIAGPTATRMLADYGATIVRVESTRRLDTIRVSPPWQFSQPHPEGAAGFQSANANKLGLTLDLSSDAGREVALDLVRWADVVTESFAPGVLDALGLGWQTLSSIKPELILLSSCIMGQTGPWRDFTGFGRLAVAVAGFAQLASSPGRPPAGPFGAYTDALSSRFNALAVLAAVDHRRETGEGQHVDLSQLEASLHYVAPAVLDWTVNGRRQEPVGNADELMHPHGVYPCRGTDAWVAIAVRDDHDWRELCAAIEAPELLDQRESRDRVDAAIARHTASRRAAEIESALQARGIPSHAVLDTPGLFADPQLQHRGHFIEIESELFPTTTIESSRLRFSRAPARVPERALSLGRDNRKVLADLLGYTEERISQLDEANVLS